MNIGKRLLLICENSTYLVSDNGLDFFSPLEDTTTYDIGGNFVDFPRRGGIFYDSSMSICNENPCSASAKLISISEEKFIVTRSFNSSDYVMCVGVKNEQGTGERFFWGYLSVEEFTEDDFSYGSANDVAGSYTSSLTLGGYTYSDVYVLQHGQDTVYFNRSLGILRF
ncbi:hypothetical protein [Parvicella tangerina]|uniref:Uncharacterized protein n=1 Tax=Parvicella tangerina TaxID=2829795 RepID=A0A916JP32_9FLAO|nr:hypothetical protein [Parvicella tangerina]CAG5085131.1 hypothetical protein CRYO30217_02657 [Parvicella tangerina]